MARSVLDILVASKEIDDREAVEVKKESKKKNISVEEELLLRGLTDETVLKAKGEALGVPAVIIRNKKADFELLKHIPEESARHYQIAPLGMENDVMQIGMVDPESV